MQHPLYSIDQTRPRKLPPDEQALFEGHPLIYADWLDDQYRPLEAEYLSGTLP